MGLSDPDLELEELLSQINGSDDDSSEDISDLSDVDLAKKVIREGQVNLGDGRALISCPHSEEEVCGPMLNPDKKYIKYVCPVAARSLPDGGDKHLACNGPLIGIGEYRSKDGKFKRPARGPFDDCPYRPSRSREDNDRL